MKLLYFVLSLFCFFTAAIFGISNVDEISKGEYTIAFLIGAIYVLQAWNFIEHTPTNPDHEQ